MDGCSGFISTELDTAAFTMNGFSPVKAYLEVPRTRVYCTVCLRQHTRRYGCVLLWVHRPSLDIKTCKAVSFPMLRFRKVPSITKVSRCLTV
eukprot:m.317744 g.317744  ORF g.317744 m.317744 type:complete len:92 (-) comp27560_c1_seq1:84-359(-)